MSASRDLMADSAETWADSAVTAPRVPAILVPDRSKNWFGRMRGWRARFELREQRAEAFFDASRNPEHGLPVAGNRQVVSFLRGLLATRRGMVVAMVALNAAAGVAGLVVPRLLGRLIDRAGQGGQGLAQSLDRIALGVVAVVLVQALLTFGARWTSSFFGQEILAEAREHVVRFVLRLPLSKVEQASSGDLVTRVTRDVSSMSEAVRWALPQLVISSVMMVLSLVAVFANSWLLGLPTIAALVLLAATVRPYLRRAPQGYITEGGSYSTINTTLTESIEGARTIEAFGMERARIARTEDDIEESAQAERYTTTIRNLMFLAMDYAYQVPWWESCCSAPGAMAMAG